MFGYNGQKWNYKTITTLQMFFIFLCIFNSVLKK